jgi:NitT/TauT family transport system ATP-binding protein
MTVAPYPPRYTPADAKLLSIRGLGVRYGGRHGTEAIRDLDLKVERGSFHAILGPSGCGKSTLIKALAGLLEATSGEIDPEPGLPAYVPQGDSCFPWLTAEENVAFGLESRGVRKKRRCEKARELLRDLGLDEFANRYPHELSEGMRQRVAIARAFAIDADLLLMDEPLSALDFQTKMRVQSELLALWERRRSTVLYVTHDIDEALTLADRVTVLSKRPAYALETIDIPFPRPRSYREVRRTPGYGDLFAQIDCLLEG